MFSFKGKEKFDHQKIVTGFAIGITLAIVDVYIALLSEGYDLMSLFSFFNNRIISIALVAAIQMFLLGSLYGVVHFGVYFIYHFVWKMKNKDIWIGGMWLHIHDKPDPKIGVVKIRQHFYDLKVSAVNLKPNNNFPTHQQTTWYYIGTEFRPNGTQEDKLVCCYMAQRQGENNKYGLHVFQNKSMKATGRPDMLEGYFGDIFREEYGRMADAADRTGKLYFYRMPKCIKKQIFVKSSDENTLDQLALSRIASNENPCIKDSEFVRKLNWVIAKRECYMIKESIKQLCERCGNDLETQLDSWLAKIICCAVLSDSRVVVNELDFINEFLDTNWSKEFIMQILYGFEANEQQESVNVKEFVASLKTLDEDLWFRFKKLVFISCEYIVKSDGNISQFESKYLESLKYLFGQGDKILI